MLSADREWASVPGADDDTLKRLMTSSAVELPSEYLAFLRHSNGGEGPLAAQPYYVQIDPADEVAAGLEQRRHDEFFPGFVMIGSNGGGEYIALDVRGSAPWPVVAIDMTNCDIAESVRPIASSFAAFSDLIGKEAGTV